MERYCSTSQSPQRVVAPTEEEEEVRPESLPQIARPSSAHSTCIVEREDRKVLSAVVFFFFSQEVNSDVMS